MSRRIFAAWVATIFAGLGGGYTGVALAEGRWVSAIFSFVLLCVDALVLAVVYVDGPRDHIHVYKDAAGEWRWRRIARNNRIIADSGEGYETEEGAERAALRSNQDIL